MRIDPNHKISLAGEYHPGINYCPECGEEVSTARYGIGVADSPMGLVLVVQCPKCFTKYYFHCRDTEEMGGHYYYFVTFLGYDENHWLNPDGSEKL